MRAFLSYVSTVFCIYGADPALEMFMNDKEAQPYVQAASQDSVSFVKYLLMCEFSGAKVFELSSTAARDEFNKLFATNQFVQAASGNLLMNNGMAGVFRVVFSEEMKIEHEAEAAYAFVRFLPEFAGCYCFYYRYDIAFIRMNEQGAEYVDRLWPDQNLFFAYAYTTSIY